MILQDFSHGNGVQSKKIWNIWDETNQEIRQVFQDVVICDLDFSASQFAQELGLSIHKPVSRPRHQTSGWPQSLLGTFRNKGYLLVGSQRTCMVCQGVKGKVKLYSKLFKVNFLGLLGTHSFWSCLVHIKSSHKLKLLDDWWLMLRTSLAPHSTLLIESHLDYLFRAKHPQVQNKYPL